SHYFQCYKHYVSASIKFSENKNPVSLWPAGCVNIYPRKVSAAFSFSTLLVCRRSTVHFPYSHRWLHRLWTLHRRLHIGIHILRPGPSPGSSGVEVDG